MFHKRLHYLFHQIMPTHIEVARLGRKPKAFQFLNKGLVCLAPLWKSGMKLCDSTVDLGTQQVEHRLRIEQVDITQRYYLGKVCHGKIAEASIAISPHVPRKQRPNRFGELRQISFEIKDRMVIVEG